jgi:hypothetical protein
MRVATVIALFAAATASAQGTTKLVGFITVAGDHVNPSCSTPDEQLAHLTLVSGSTRIEVPVTCAAAPALAFAAEVPSGRYSVTVTPDQLDSRIAAFTAPRRLDVSGRMKLVSLEAHRAPTAALPAQPSSASLIAHAVVPHPEP